MTTTHTSGAADRPEARLFTKKPVTIAAIQWTGKNLREVIALTDGTPDTRTMHAGMAWEAYTDLVARDGLKIYTLEGTMLASPGDWIIRGVKGEMYPCKDEIFEATYSPAALAAGQATAAQAGEYPALVCDYCGALTPDPWHSSGMLHGKMSKHIHSCDACASHGQAPAGAAHEADSAPAVGYPPLPNLDGSNEQIWEAIFNWKTATPGADAVRKANKVENAIIGTMRACVDADRAARAPADSVQEDAAREAIEKVLALFPFNVPIQKFTVNNGPCLTADNDDEFYSVKRVLAFLTEIKTTLDAARKQGGV